MIISLEIDTLLSDRQLEVADVSADRDEVLVKLTGEHQPPPVDELGRRFEEVQYRKVVLTVNLTYVDRRPSPRRAAGTERTA